MNASSCGTDRDKQIAAHTSLGAHLQAEAGTEAPGIAANLPTPVHLENCHHMCASIIISPVPLSLFI